MIIIKKKLSWTVKMFLNVVIKQNYLHQLSPACVCSHTNTQLCLGLCHVGPENNNAVLLPPCFCH